MGRVAPRTIKLVMVSHPTYMVQSTVVAPETVVYEVLADGSREQVVLDVQLEED